MKYFAWIVPLLLLTGCSSCMICARQPHIVFTPHERIMLDKVILDPARYLNNYAHSHQIKEPYIRTFMSENPGFVDLQAFAKAHPDHPLNTLKLWYEALFFSPYDTVAYRVMLWPDSKAAIHYLDTIQEPQNGMKKIYRIGSMLLIYDVRDNRNLSLPYNPNHPVIAWMQAHINKISE